MSLGNRAAAEFVTTELLANDGITPAQLASPSRWSPQRKLAGAVLAGALVEVRDHYDNLKHRRDVRGTLAWISTNDVDWPFSFIPLCHLFDLDPDYVRNVVNGWLRTGVARTPRQSSAQRHAA